MLSVDVWSPTDPSLSTKKEQTQSWLAKISVGVALGRQTESEKPIAENELERPSFKKKTTA